MTLPIKALVASQITLSTQARSENVLVCDGLHVLIKLHQVAIHPYWLKYAPAHLGLSRESSQRFIRLSSAN